MDYAKIVTQIREIFNSDKFIPLHAPTFNGNEKKYLINTIDSTFVSSVGEYVNLFESELSKFTNSKFAIACVNGTNALHIALVASDVKSSDEVITQALSFIATANAISYTGATPIFIDVDMDTMGMSPNSLISFLEKNCEKRKDGFTYNKKTNKRIKACVPMHTFGFPLRIDEISNICKNWNISLIEDSAESLGSFYKGVHTGNFGEIGVFSFNGNKTITAGGGGPVITNDEAIAKKIKHLTTQAKIPHQWRFMHDEIGYNYRMPNLNAALICAQLEQLNGFLLNKRELAEIYSKVFENTSVKFVNEIKDAKANYWLNTILFNDNNERDEFLKISNENGVMTRPAWDLMITLNMFLHCQHDGLINSKILYDRLVNIPSSVRLIS